MNRPLARAAVISASLSLAACGGSSAPPPSPPPPVNLTTFQAASSVLGQKAFTDPPPVTNPCTNWSLGRPWGSAAWNGAQLLVPDSSASRILVFAGVPGPETDPLTAPAASWVVGQSAADLAAGRCGGGVAAFLTPQALATAGGLLVVPDPGLNRVFVYGALPPDSGATATPMALGGTGACAATDLNTPEAAFLVGSKLIVADSGNNRVLVWNDVAAAPGTGPNLVLGQLDATSCLANRGAAATRGSMRYPNGIWSDGTRLVVADTDNNRLLVWSAFPTTPGQVADLVLTAADPAVVGTVPNATFQGPRSVAWDGAHLFVADTLRNRVVAYPSFPTKDTDAVSVVIGQSDLAHVTANDATQTGTPATAPTAKTLYNPTGVAFVNGTLAVTDTLNGRVLLFRSP